MLTDPADREPSELEEMVAIRDRLKAAFFDEATPARDLASVSRRLLEVGDRIKALRLAEQEAGDDESDQKTDEAWEGV